MPVANLPRAIGHISSSVFAMDGRLVVLGGETSHGSNTAEATAYDPDTNTWTTLTPLPAPRHSGVADVIDGVMYYSTGNSSGTFKGVPQTPTPATQRFNFQPAGVPVPAVRPPTRAWRSPRRAVGWVREDTRRRATPGRAGRLAERPGPQPARRPEAGHLHPHAVPAAQRTGRRGDDPGAWELAVPNGAYTVTVSVGDAGATFDSTTASTSRAQVAIGGFVPTSANHSRRRRDRHVADGRPHGRRPRRDEHEDRLHPCLERDGRHDAACGAGRRRRDPGNALGHVNWNANTDPDLPATRSTGARRAVSTRAHR